MKWYVVSYEQFNAHDAVELSTEFTSISTALWKYRFALIDTIDTLIRSIELMDINDTDILD